MSQGFTSKYVTAASGKMIQTVNAQDGTVATGTTLIPVDNTIPQNTEGFEILTVSITPTSSTNKLKIEIQTNLAMNTTSRPYLTAALFQDSTADALAVTTERASSGTNENHALSLTYWMTAGTTSSTTFKIRVGSTIAGTTTVNGGGGAGMFNGTMRTAITITEIAA